MATPSEATTFVKQKLDAIITPFGWTTITHEAYVGVLANKFSVYSRERCLEDLSLNGFDDFTKYQSLMNIRGTGEDIVFACDTEWQTIKTGNTSYRFIISWQFSYIKDEQLTEDDRKAAGDQDFRSGRNRLSHGLDQRGKTSGKRSTLR